MSRRAGRRTTGALALLLLIAGTTSCIREISPTATSTVTPSPQRRTFDVYAPAPFREAFEEIAGDFEFTHEDVDVSLAFGTHQELTERLERGDAPDLIVSETETSMETAAISPGVEQPEPFARIGLVVIMPPGNPAEIEAFTDLGRPDVDLVLVNNHAPLGQESRVALASGGILIEALRNVVIGAPDVAALVDTIEAGAADAGIAYASYVSVAADNELTSIDIPDEANVETVYSIGVLSNSDEPELARTFIGWMSTAGGKAVLEDHGFETFD